MWCSARAIAVETLDALTIAAHGAGELRSQIVLDYAYIAWIEG